MEHIGAHGPIPSTISLFFNVVFMLFFLALGNGAVRRLRPRWALNQGELIIVYVMLTISTASAGLDGMQVLIPVMTHGFWFANPENRYDQMLEVVPRWLVVADKRILYGYYNGSSSFYQGAIVQAWLTPVLWWTGFIVVLVFVMICLSVIVRSQWADRERLTFPIIQLPLAVSEQGTPLWRNPLLWIGFALAGSIDLVNGLHYLYPAIPYLSIAPTLDSGGSNDLMKYIPDMPWAGIGWLPVTFYPAVIGISFLVPLDLLFSSVFFFWFWKLMFVIAAATGMSQGYSESEKTVFPYVNEQMFGGYIAIALGPMFVGRRYFREVGLRILGRKSEVDDSEEGMSYRTAAIGVVIGVILLVLFAVRGGLSLRLASLFFVIYYLVSLAVARVRAEFGSPVHDFHLAGPGQTMTYVAGTASMGQRDLSMLSVLWWFNRAYRSHPIGISIEGVQMAHRSRSSSRGADRGDRAGNLRGHHRRVLGLAALRLQHWASAPSGTAATPAAWRCAVSAELGSEPDAAQSRGLHRHQRRFRHHLAAGRGEDRLHGLAAAPRRLRPLRELVDPPGVDADADRLGGEGDGAALRRSAPLSAGAAAFLWADPG